MILYKTQAIYYEDSTCLNGLNSLSRGKHCSYTWSFPLWTLNSTASVYFYKSPSFDCRTFTFQRMRLKAIELSIKIAILSNPILLNIAFFGILTTPQPNNSRPRLKIDRIGRGKEGRNIHWWIQSRIPVQQSHSSDHDHSGHLVMKIIPSLCLCNRLFKCRKQFREFHAQDIWPDWSVPLVRYWH